MSLPIDKIDFVFNSEFGTWMMILGPKSVLSIKGLWYCLVTLFATSNQFDGHAQLFFILYMFDSACSTRKYFCITFYSYLLDYDLKVHYVEMSIFFNITTSEL